MHTLKPLDEDLIVASGKDTGAIFTIEEHSIIGGLGSAVSQVLMEGGIKAKFHCFGVEDKFTKIAGSQEYLRIVNGLSINQISKSILKIMTSKND